MVLTGPRYNLNVAVICIFLMGEYVPFLSSRCPVILLLKSVYSIDFPTNVIVCFPHVNFSNNIDKTRSHGSWASTLPLSYLASFLFNFILIQGLTKWQRDLVFAVLSWLCLLSSFMCKIPLSIVCNTGSMSGNSCHLRLFGKVFISLFIIKNNFLFI